MSLIVILWFPVALFVYFYLVLTLILTRLGLVFHWAAMIMKKKEEEKKKKKKEKEKNKKKKKKKRRRRKKKKW